MLISSSYLQEQIRLHKEDSTYANTSGKWAYLVSGIMSIERFKSLLDYGCGKGELGKQLVKSSAPFWVAEYDPAVPDKSTRPLAFYDLVTCIDVMEHIEPEFLQNVIMDLSCYTKSYLFLVISTKFTKNRWLSDGRNSHLIVNEGSWWEEKFKAYGFKVVRTWNTGVKEWVALMEKTG